ncbi:hypothetical protein [Dictyobacter kobayashii]|uniref:hypothetical protein n=1 Tax=Dictyobacter kobayashii TaxID=2014872 RepID=UPI000F81ED5C|nr:hypothetical protein [Dictyobacter kobayashii]
MNTRARARSRFAAKLGQAQHLREHAPFSWRVSLRKNMNDTHHNKGVYKVHISANLHKVQPPTQHFIDRKDKCVLEISNSKFRWSKNMPFGRKRTTILLIILCVVLFILLTLVDLLFGWTLLKALEDAAGRTIITTVTIIVFLVIRRSIKISKLRHKKQEGTNNQ